MAAYDPIQAIRDSLFFSPFRHEGSLGTSEESLKEDEYDLCFPSYILLLVRKESLSPAHEGTSEAPKSFQLTCTGAAALP